jgi:hypothetical protein
VIVLPSKEDAYAAANQTLRLEAKSYTPYIGTPDRQQMTWSWSSD